MPIIIFPDHHPEVDALKCDLHEFSYSACGDMTYSTCNCGFSILICRDSIEALRRRFTCPFHGDEY